MCEPVSMTCVQCLSNAQCLCPTAQCELSSHTCVESLADAGTFVQPAGESCADPQVIVFSACSPRRTGFQVDLGTRQDNERGSCAGTGTGRDAVFLLNVPTLADVKVSTSQAPGSTAQAVSFLRTSPCASGAERVCVNEWDNDQHEHLRARGLDAGTYFLFVEGFGARGSGKVQLTSWATAPVPIPSNDTCRPHRVIDFTNTSSARFAVDTQDAENDELGSCGEIRKGGREVVYAFTLGSQRTVTVTAESADGADAVDPVIFLRQGLCAGDAGTFDAGYFDAGFSDGGPPFRVGNEVGCVDETGAREVLVRALPAGQYFLFVDSYDSTSAGPTVVTVTLSP